MASLTARLEAIDRRRVALLDELAALDPALLDARPRPGKWSMREIVEHLVLAERYVLRDLAAAADRPARPPKRNHRALYALVWCVLRFGIPVRAPSRSMLPTGDVPLDELRERWDANVASLRSYLADLGPDARRRRVFSHPVTGPLTMDQTLGLMSVHLHTHTRQIRRLQRLLS